MQQFEIFIQTKSQGTIEITSEITALAEKAKMSVGLCHLFLHHTSASIILCENYDPDVRKDLEDFAEAWLKKVAIKYIHNAEGEDDMPAHIKTVFTQSELTIPITNGKLALGTWQGIYLWEHRTSNFKRKITVTVWGG